MDINELFDVSRSGKADDEKFFCAKDMSKIKYPRSLILNRFGCLANAIKIAKIPKKKYRKLK